MPGKDGLYIETGPRLSGKIIVLQCNCYQQFSLQLGMVWFKFLKEIQMAIMAICQVCSYKTILEVMAFKNVNVSICDKISLHE